MGVKRDIFILTLVILAKVTHVNNEPTNKQFQPVLIQSKTIYQVDLKTQFYIGSKDALKIKSDNRLSALYIIPLLLTSCHYPEPNPGPRMPKYPCGQCYRAVKNLDEGVLCDKCNTWFHIKCENIPSDMYKNCLLGSDFSWYCTNCGLPNFASSLFDTSLIPETTNMFDSLNDSDLSLNLTNPGSPQMTSSPKHTMNRKIAKHGRRPLPNDTEKVRIMVVNCQSLRQKKDIFQTAIGRINPDVIIGTESWLDPSLKNGDIFPEEFKGNVYRKDRKNDKHGGVFVAIKNTYVSEEAEELKCNAEIVWAKMTLPSGNKLYVGSVYHPHTNDIDSLDEIKKNLKMASSGENQTVWVGGDFNLPDIEWKNNTSGEVRENSRNKQLHQEFIDFTADSGLAQVVNQPTRGDNTLDLFFTNTPSTIYRSEVCPGISDHDIVYIEATTKPVKHKQIPRQIFNYKKADYESMKTETETFVKSYIENHQSCMNIDVMWNDLKTHLDETIRKHIPQRTIKHQHGYPWITPELRHMIRRRDRLYNKMKKKQNDNMRRRYKELRHQVQKETRNAYWSYISNIIAPGDKPDTKKFFSFLKSIRKETAGVPPLKHQGTIATDTTSKANSLNKQFESVFTTDNDKTMPKLGDKILNKMKDINITTNGVTKLLKNLNPKKASGPDNLTPRILNELHLELTPAVTLLFQRSMELGQTPSDWKHAFVCPIYKKGARHNPANYRPISLTCILCKLLEHIVVSNLMSHLEENNILSEFQHGFRGKRSCETQLIGLIEDLTSTLDCNTQTDMIVLDFSKAFDKVSHPRLLHKLEHYGISGRTHSWITAFLSNRTQAVVIENAHSDKVNVGSGVPQGSVLGPVLFLLFINDITDNITSTIRLFADDCTIYRPIRSKLDHQKLQEDLTKLTTWESKWKMEFNVSKCNVMHITRSRRPLITPYNMHGEHLEVVHDTKYLGLTIKDDLNWNSHINNIVAGSNQVQGMLSRNIKKAPQQTKITAVNTLIRPKVEYGAAIWDPFTNENIDKLERVQRRAARYVCNNYSYEASVTAMMNQLNWIPLQQRRQNIRLCWMYKITYGLVAVPLENYLALATRQSRHYNSMAYKIFSPRHDYYKHSFFPRTVIEWNRLPDTIVKASTVEAFKAAILA